MDGSKWPVGQKRQSMDETNQIGLQLHEMVRKVSSGGRLETTFYTISGLPPDDTCVVGCPGMGFGGKKKWYVRWDRSGDQLATPEASYDSPEDALKAVTELKKKGI